jgi:hypothetical protein
MNKFNEKKYKKIIDKMIKPGEFCRIVMDISKDVDLPVNSEVYVCGARAIPEDFEDPYTQRIKLLVMPLVDGDTLDASRIYLIDPTRVERINSKRTKMLQQLLQNTFGEEGDEDESLAN